MVDSFNRESLGLFLTWRIFDEPIDDSSYPNVLIFILLNGVCVLLPILFVVTYGKVGLMYSVTPVNIYDIAGISSCPYISFMVLVERQDNGIGSRVVLQEVLPLFFFGVKTADTLVGSHPYTVLLVFEHAVDMVVG